MRNKIWPLVVGFCLIVFPLLGSDMAPTSLPMGNSLLDLIVGNNPCSVTIILQSTNATDPAPEGATGIDSVTIKV